MARTSKTTIGGGSGESNDRMMRAASSGADARQRAHSELMNEYRSGADQANQTAQVANQVIGQGLERNQQQAQFERTADQRDDATDLEAAKAGFERGGGGDRAAQLEAEMQKGASQPQIGALDPQSQQRLNQQAEQGLEMDAHGRWRPTKERQDAQARQQRREDFAADTERIRAEAYRDQIGIQAQKAYASGNQEEFEAKSKEAAQFANSTQKLFDRIKDGDIDDSDWPGLEKAAKGSEDFDPSLMNDIKSKNASPRVLSFLRTQVQAEALKAIVRTGDDSNLKIDWTYPQMRAFIQTRDSINDFSRANPALAATAMIRSTADKMRFINQTAAMQVLFGMSQPASPTAGMTPATQGPGGQAPGGGMQQQPKLPPGSTQVPGRAAGTQAVRDARAGGASPEEALQAGQDVAPTNEDAISRERLRQRQLSSQVQGMR